MNIDQQYMGSSLGSISMIPFVSDADKGQDFKIGSFKQRPRRQQ